MIMDIIRSVLSKDEPSFKPASVDWERHRKATEECVRKSGLFDARWYLDQYPDVRNARIDPLHHFLRHGGTELRNPSAAFDAREYVRRYPDAATGHPLLHFLRYRDERQLTAPKVGEANTSRQEPLAARHEVLLTGGSQADRSCPASWSDNRPVSAPQDRYDHDFPIGYGEFITSHGYGSLPQAGQVIPASPRRFTREDYHTAQRQGHRVEAGPSAPSQQLEQLFSDLEMQQIKRALAPLGLSVDDTITLQTHIPGTHGARPVTTTGVMLRRNSVPQAQPSNVTHNAQIGTAMLWT